MVPAAAAVRPVLVQQQLCVYSKRVPVLLRGRNSRQIARQKLFGCLGSGVRWHWNTAAVLDGMSPA